MRSGKSEKVELQRTTPSESGDKLFHAIIFCPLNFARWPRTRTGWERILRRKRLGGAVRLPPFGSVLSHWVFFPLPVALYHKTKIRPLPTPQLTFLTPGPPARPSRQIAPVRRFFTGAHPLRVRLADHRSHDALWPPQGPVRVYSFPWVRTLLACRSLRKRQLAEDRHARSVRTQGGLANMNRPWGPVKEIDSGRSAIIDCLPSSSRDERENSSGRIRNPEASCRCPEKFKKSST